MSQVSIRELARHMSEVLERVASGETVEVTRNGTPVAVISAPDPVEAKMRELVDAGVLPPDWRERQAELSDWLKTHQPLPATPGQRPLSEVLLEMRAEERG